MIRGELGNRKAKHHSQKNCPSRLIHPQIEYLLISSNFPELMFKMIALTTAIDDHTTWISLCRIVSCKLESELFSFLLGRPQCYNLTKAEWLAMGSLAADRSTIIKPADKGSCVIVSDRGDYLAELYKQLSDTSAYLEVKN